MDANRQCVQIRGTRIVPRNANDQIYCTHQDVSHYRRRLAVLVNGINIWINMTVLSNVMSRTATETGASPTPVVSRATIVSSGDGFTRQGNLQADLGRRHLHTNDVSCGSTMQGNPRVSMGIPANHLPVAIVDRCHEYSAGERLSETNDAASLRNEFKQLIRDVQEQNRRLEELEHTVTVLQAAIASSSHLQLKKQYDPVRT
ncbi:uncharacterized protein N7482_010215 [Penicillium canariense]|uniref:Uncharacterized protein n=1 Tax=Penicillium canariense TaxID=189055 RepID=A0A9W9HJF6_9EURO|nr:uncharacterized protein N7482_010215 [Penicillium canariense]KAJ5150963.1 hypothetical protein N7482_010215 [Penicillium canariense]